MLRAQSYRKRKIISLLSHTLTQWVKFMWVSLPGLLIACHACLLRNLNNNIKKTNKLSYKFLQEHGSIAIYFSTEEHRQTAVSVSHKEENKIRDTVTPKDIRRFYNSNWTNPSCCKFEHASANKPKFNTQKIPLEPAKLKFTTTIVNELLVALSVHFFYAISGFGRHLGNL